MRTNANADVESIDAPFTPEQRAKVEAEADLCYTDFVQRVAEGRKLSTAAVDAVAQGRIWTGEDALERGLVDELGGLRTALRRAKILAGLDEDADVRVVSYPGSALWEFLRPRPSSQPAAASVGDAVAAVLSRSVTRIIEQSERALSGAHALWLGDTRF
ncbi:peptidase S49 family protein [Mycobacterium xenopi 4042]|uniref:Peptidase S49 family protein n=1 Tax=Mycobacterium xenopi 4042 TaxID=1299334 RepID=X7YIX7_MYCXE|nr:peptidase S49 family protein [Mycobacterium xenopi 4042]